MPFAAALSEHPDAATAVGEACGHVLEQLGEAPDVALLFFTAAHAAAAADIVEAVRAIVDPAVLAGCAAVSVVGTGREVEERPGLSLWAGVTGPALPVRLGAIPVGEREVAISGWPADDELGFEPSALVVFADPYSFPAEALLGFVDEHRPGLPVVGGLASAPAVPSVAGAVVVPVTGRGGSQLVLDGDIVSGGAVGVFLGPGVAVQTVVSQGCRPIGEPWSVTEADGNVIRSLGGKPPLFRLMQLAEDGLTEDEVALVNAGALHVGRVIDERKATFGPGDFLVRNVVGVDRATGALAIGDAVEVGMTLQFHLRDAAAADDDLHRVLMRARGGWGAGLPDRGSSSALIFTCNGRGQATFGEPDHDAAVVADLLGSIPTAGFFAAGEFGPVGGRNFLHGFTASIALVSDADIRR